MMVTTKSFALTFLHYSSHNFCELFSINMMNQAAETLIRYKKKKKKKKLLPTFTSLHLYWETIKQSIKPASIQRFHCLQGGGGLDLLLRVIFI